jgi:formate C-acetyltransferase
MADLVAATRANFQGADDLRMLVLKRAPKYGNDIPYVDELAAEVSRHYCQTMHDLRTVRGGRFFAHLFSFIWHISPCGLGTGALPDGRKAGEPLAYSLSPMQGRDLKGLTALFHSLLAIPHHMAAGSSSAIVEVDPQLFQTEGKEKFTRLLKTALDHGLGQVQFNVTTADTLEKAKASPDQYPHLAVRVSGYSYRFVLLGPEMQDHIIARTKHKR